MKDASEEEFVAAAEQIGKLCREHEAVFVLDDHAELVERCGADGVHLGKNDMPVDEARRLLGNDRIIGGTANTFEDIERLHRQGADYIGCGPFRFTTTKKNLSPVLGLEGYKRIVSDMKTIDNRPERFNPCCRAIQRKALCSGKTVARTSNSQVDATRTASVSRPSGPIVFVRI
jgi:thiamine-phosphate diphosphorylase